MTDAVAAALAEQRHLLIEAGTGTGKSLAYLAAVVATGSTVVVATATKALQDQLAHVDLPFLADRVDGHLTWSVIKGRGSYLCAAKLSEQLANPQLTAVTDHDGAPVDAVGVLEELADWAGSPAGASGDRDDAPFAVADELWRDLSVSGTECPGANRCPHGRACFAEAALAAGRGADVIVTNHHLYAMHLATGERLLPDHDAVIFDEGHRIENAFAAASTFELSARRLTSFATRARPYVGDEATVDAVLAAGDRLDGVLRTSGGGRCTPEDEPLGTVLADVWRATKACLDAVDRVELDHPAAGPTNRVINQGRHLLTDTTIATDLPAGWVAWTEPHRRALRVAPIEIADTVADDLLSVRPVVITSATLTLGGSFEPLADRLGFTGARRDVEPDDAIDFDVLKAADTFDYSQQGLLYVPNLPEPGHPDWADAAAHEVELLVEAAGGRALVLTTSHAMTRHFSSVLSGGPFPVLTQGDDTKRRLVDRFRDDEAAVLVATMGFWEGIDVPGRTLSLVIVDKLPFPRPDDPLIAAKRDAAAARGRSPFDVVDLPLAAMLLAQGSGRLIRGEQDRGVVAVLDSRLASRRYGRRILRTLPPFPRTAQRQRAVRLLEEIVTT